MKWGVFMIAVLLDKDINIPNLLANYEIVRQIKKHDYDLYVANINGKNVLFANFGHTKVQVGLLMGEITSEFPITSIIQVGNCASINGSSLINDMAISNSSVQYDVDYQPIGYGKNVIPVINQSTFPAGSDLVAVAKTSSNKLGASSTVGNFAGADRFLANALTANLLRSESGIDYVDSESGTIGEVSYMYRVPFVAVKGVSNYGNASAPTDYALHAPMANTRSSLVALDMVDTLTGPRDVNRCYQYRTLNETEIQAVASNNNNLMLSLTSINQPYTVPMFYIYAMVNGINYIFMLSNRTGQKMSALAVNQRACVVIQQNSSMGAEQGNYSSVIAFGTAQVFSLTPTGIQTLTNRFPTQQRSRVSTLVNQLITFPQVCGSTNTLIMLPVASWSGRYYFISG